jgi:hypothetical protein
MENREMTMPGATATRLADGEHPLLALLEGTDSVKLKLSAPETDRFSAAQALGMDPLDAHVRLVHFFDTPELALLASGLVLRARRLHGHREDARLTLRHVTPRALPRALRHSSALSVEVAALPRGAACTTGLKSRPRTGDVARAAAGELPVHALFGKELRDAYRARLPDGPALDDLVAFGPVVVLKLKYTPEVLGRRLVGELWHLPGGEQVLELSTRCHPEDALAALAETRAFLARYGVEAAGGPEPTRRALELLADPTSRLRPAARRDPPRPSVAGRADGNRRSTA